jgi:hypothetical protein
MESFDDYKKRLLGYLGDRDPLEVMGAMPAALRSRIGDLPSSTLYAPPAPAKWSIAQIMAHLADSDLVFGYRVRAILAKSGTPIAAYDQDAWAAAFKYEQIPAEQSLARITAVRESTLVLLQSLAADEWQRYGIHEERGRESVDDLTRLYAGHDLNHMQQIDRIINATAR